MKKFSDKLTKMLTGFIVAEIGTDGLDGITYCMKIKNSRNAQEYNQYLEIREEANKCGYDKDEVFRVHELVNGYVFDIDMSTMVKVLMDVARATVDVTGKNKELLSKVYREPEAVRKREVKRLANAILKKIEAGENSIDVALFNKNSTDKAGVTVDTPDGKSQYVYLNAYALRHWDIKVLNEQLLMKRGYRVARVIPKYVLSSENGIHTTLEFEKM